jgi:hypothetical protein
MLNSRAKLTAAQIQRDPLPPDMPPIRKLQVDFFRRLDKWHGFGRLAVRSFVDPLAPLEDCSQRKAVLFRIWMDETTLRLQCPPKPRCRAKQF